MHLRRESTAVADPSSLLPQQPAAKSSPPEKKSSVFRDMGKLAERLRRYIKLSARRINNFTAKLFSPSAHVPALPGVAESSFEEHVLRLAAEDGNTFAKLVENFVSRTLHSPETNPRVVMLSMRQFMTNMKNYLAKLREKEIHNELKKSKAKEKARGRCAAYGGWEADEEEALEAAVERAVARPLEAHVRRLLACELRRSGAAQQLAAGLRAAAACSPRDLGVEAALCLPPPAALAAACAPLRALPLAPAPAAKAACLLACADAANAAVQEANAGRRVQLGADHVLPLFVWALVRSGLADAELEAEYMWGLTDPSRLAGQEGYFLTTLTGAVHVLKNFHAHAPADKYPPLDAPAPAPHSTAAGDGA